MMPMNLVIQKKRKELGLTQEQVAEYLNVSVPAVSKWEKGTTSPDISLLTPLARLLKTDLNTLFCFQKDITFQEISLLCKEIQELVQSQGIQKGFTAAEEKFREYPHSEHLLHVLTIQLDGLLIMSGMTAEEMRPFDERITAWYQRLAESPDRSISSSANFMLAGHYIRREEYERAQETLDRIPDRRDILIETPDKLMLQVEIYKHQGQEEKAGEELQKELWSTLNKVQILLGKLMDIELECGNIPAAQQIADKSSQMAKLFELWDFQVLLGPLLMALAQKDTGTCISLLRKIPAALRRAWEPEKTVLFSRIQVQNHQAENVLSGILSSIKQEPLLKNSPELQALIADYEQAAGSP